MTHEYVIALGGTILAPVPGGDPRPTAIAWAADRILAIGSDEVVRAISRGDSTFLDLDGSTVTAAPAGLLLDASTMTLTGALQASEPLAVGSPADLAFWRLEPGTPAHGRESWRIVAIVARGAFTEGDEHTGPFSG